MRNPFKPGFGASPPLLAGRDDALQEFVYSLDDGPGAPGRSTLYTGARGAGKTVMLNAVEDEAKKNGWIVISETATPGLITRLTESRLPSQLRELDPEALKRRLSHLSIPVAGGGASWDTMEVHIVKMDLRQQVSLMCDLLAENETGLLITIDEIHRNQKDELGELVAVFQHAIREDRDIAFAAAGLKAAVNDLLQEKVLTFLRRAERYELGSVDLDEVARALEGPINDSGKQVSPDALKVMVEGTRGYPFLIQLVGSQCWRESGRTKATIDLSDAQKGVAGAQRRLGSMVHDPALAGLSSIDKSFLLAMAKDDGPSKMADIAKRMKVDSTYASIYRLRLIDSELIESPAHGLVDFTLPYLREYLREHAASQV